MIHIHIEDLALAYVDTVTYPSHLFFPSFTK